MEPILTAEHLYGGYGNRKVLHDVSLAVKKGERLLLIGPNGCGKTTLLKVLAGALNQDQGRIFLQGEDVSHTPGHLRVKKGLGYLMQTRNIFPSLSVDENLHLSFWHGNGAYEERREWILSLFTMLRDKLGRRAGLLSGGERQALAISMVLMQPVGILLLDEPTAGLSPKAAMTILEAIHQAQQVAGLTSILVEHNLRLVHQWVSRVLVMNEGHIVAEEDDPSVVLDHDKLQRYYFG